jgi:EAL domain-containing protein (putative c-di-GMP-specific phosphodiesterase class I)
MAFQPIVALDGGRVYAHEALVRAPGGGSAAAVLRHVTPANQRAFHRLSRRRAFALAAGQLAVGERLSLNLQPGAVETSACFLEELLEDAAGSGLAAHQLILEITESERARDPVGLARAADRWRAAGVLTAIDDFGAGHAGLSLLADWQPDLLKLDMSLIRGIDADPVREAIVAGLIGLAGRLGATLVAEGVETDAELASLTRLGVTHVQGYLLARPELQGFVRPLPVLAR